MHTDAAIPAQTLRPRTPLLNPGPCAYTRSDGLKNAIDFLFAEWNNKAAGFVSYGVASGSRAVEHLRLIMGELQVADVRAQVALSLVTDFENFSVLKPAAQHEDALTTMLDQVIAWGEALRPLRPQYATV